MLHWFWCLQFERGRANASPRCHKLWRALSHSGEMLGQNSPSGSAMEAPALSHRPCWSPIDPAQVSMFSQRSAPSFYSYLALHPLYVGYSLMYSFWQWCLILSPWHTTTSTTNPILTHWFLYVLYMCMYIVDRGRGKEITYHTHQPHL